MFKNQNNNKIGKGADGIVTKGKNCYIKGKLKITDKNKYVSKYFKSYTDLMIEYDNYNKLNLKAIDPTQKFFIGIPEICQLKPNINNTNTNTNTNTLVINYLYGGKNLSDYLKNYISLTEEKVIKYIKKFLFAFTNIIEGINLLHQNHIFHLDIKSDNIVYNDNDNIMRLIDFGHSKNINENIGIVDARKFIDEIIIDSNHRGLHMTSTYCPPEFFCSSQSIKVEPFIHDYTFTKRKSTKKRKKHSSIKTKKKSGSFIIKSNNVKKNIYDMGSFDMWSLGIVLIDIINFISEYEFFTEFNIPKLAKIIDQLTIIDPNNRINSETALSLYKTYIETIEDL
jgi:serine/threonine protein kinase